VSTDLLVGLISVTTDLVWHITVQWYAGNALCKLVRYLQVRVPLAPTYKKPQDFKEYHYHNHQNKKTKSVYPFITDDAEVTVCLQLMVSKQPGRIFLCLSLNRLRDKLHRILAVYTDIVESAQSERQQS